MDESRKKATICLVIPCFNEAKRLQTKAFEDAIVKQNLHFLFVNDGSSDHTLEVLQAFASQYPNQVRIVDSTPNLGKGNAVRKGMLDSLLWKPFDYTGYWDADLSAPLSEVKIIVEPMLAAGYQFAFGSRLLRIGGNIKRNGFRHYVSRISATFAAETLGLPVYDTQCGAKIFSHQIVEGLFKMPFISSWLFDVELFFRAKQLWNKAEFYKHTIEIPITKWTEVGGSRLRFNNLIKVPLELFKIRNFYKNTW